MSIRAFIVGCSGQTLTKDERDFFREANPWGFILFGRNIANPKQVKNLVRELRESVGRAMAPVLIDQEGGRVQRLKPPHWPKYPSGQQLGEIYARDPLLGREICRIGGMLIAHDLRALGINVDCLPVLDVPVAGAHDVIGDRAYARSPEIVAILGRAAAEGLLAGGVMPVIKHIPGHGRASVDSHLELPIVRASREQLEEQDFFPFRCLADMPAAMSAHVVYAAIDNRKPATLSRKLIGHVVRGHIGFDGLLISDDLSMKALGGTFEKRSSACFAAGIDIALHCNGDLAEMQAVASAAPLLIGKSRARAQAALNRIAHLPEPFDVADARAKLGSALMAGLAV